MSIPAPVVGECYRWDVSADVVAMNSTTEATGYDKENILSPSLMFTGRTGDKDDLSGWTIVLAASQTIYGAEMTNCELASGERIGIATYSDAAFVTPTLNTSKRVAVASQIWTTHTQAKDFLPTRSSFIAGVDNFATTGPTPADPPVPASVACRSLIVNFDTGGSSRTYWELGFLGLITNARALDSIGEHALGIEMIQLRSGGTGFRWTVKWPRLPMLQANYMRALWASSDNGNWPIFFFPNPGQKATTGVISGERYTQGGRGGLARMISWHDDEQHGVGGSQYASNCEIVAESWQEERIQ